MFDHRSFSTRSFSPSAFQFVFDRTLTMIHHARDFALDHLPRILTVAHRLRDYKNSAHAKRNFRVGK